MPSPCVTRCGRETTDYLCRDCRSLLTGELRALVDGGRDQTGARRPGLLDELDDTVSRRHVLSSGTPLGVRARSPEAPVPFHETAAELRNHADNAISTWARELAEDHPHWSGYPNTIAGAAAWLSRRGQALAIHPAADECFDALTGLVSRIRIVIDRARERTYLGPCTAETDTGRRCGDDLYALPEAEWVTCSACGATVAVGERRAWLLRVVDDQLATAAEISRALPTLLDAPVTAAMIRGYAHRGRLASRGTDREGRLRYRVGDVIELVTRQAVGSCA